MDDRSQIELVTGVSSGSSEALRELMRNYYPVLVHYAYGIVNDYAVAQDIAAEAFIQLWKRRKTFECLESIRKFLWVTARHDCLDALRRRNVREFHYNRLSQHKGSDIQPTALHRMISAEVLAEVYNAIHRLPKKMQRVFIMSYLHDMKNAEIAHVLGLSEQTVRNQKSRALDILRVELRANQQLLAFIAFLTTSL